jgi:hypothetical protein
MDMQLDTGTTPPGPLHRVEAPEDRMTTVRQLRRQGWRQNALCVQIQLGDAQIGGPTYMQAPNGLFYAVREGDKKHAVLNGEYRTKTESRTSVAVFRNGELM